MRDAGMSAERTAALQRAHRSAPPHFVTKRVADPNMIPMLVAAGVEFGAVKVAPLLPIPLACSCGNETEGTAQEESLCSAELAAVRG